MEKMTDEKRVKAEALFGKYSQNASEEDVLKIAGKLDGMNRGPIKKIWDDVQELWAMIKDKDTAWGTKAVAIGALIYLVSPLDIIPDLIPVAGLMDDAGVITTAISMLADALDKFRNRKEMEDKARMTELSAHIKKALDSGDYKVVNVGLYTTDDDNR